MKIEDLTIGIEEEYQIIDADSRELTSSRIFDPSRRPEVLEV